LIPGVRVWAALLASLWVFVLSDARAEERILSFSSRITVHEDASLTVRETIRVKGERKAIRRGIVREFPTTYETKSGREVRVGFDIQSVTRNGQPEPYHVKNKGNGVHIYMGQKDHYLQSGTYTYTITYTTDRQLGFFENHDELYWNVTGSGWRFPIDKAEAVVQLPPGASVTDHAAYTGRYGSTGRNFSVETNVSGRIKFRTLRPMSMGEGLTIVAAWPKGFVDQSLFSGNTSFLVYHNKVSIIGLGGALLVLIYFLVAWHYVGRDPDAGPVIPLFAPPKGLSPAASRYVLHMKYSETSFAAAIVSLAVKGALEIINSGGTFTLRRKSVLGDRLSKGERKLFAKLLGNVWEGDDLILKKDNHEKIKEANKVLEKALEKEFKESNFADNARYAIAGGLFSAFALWATFAASGHLSSLIPFFISVGLVGLFRWSLGARLLLAAIAIAGVALWEVMTSLPMPALVGIALILATNIAFYFLLRAPTKSGARLQNKIEGFKMFLSVAETERLGIVHPPDITPEVFEKFLPYAIALDVEHGWSRKFATHVALAGATPKDYDFDWYSGSYGWSSDGGVGNMRNSLSVPLSSAISSSSSPPGSSSGLGGGGISSGGGFSGGGGGGGGGGGW
jgi:uncharacterized membrane protein YgcG